MQQVWRSLVSQTEMSKSKSLWCHKESGPCGWRWSPTSWSSPQCHCSQLCNLGVTSCQRCICHHISVSFYVLSTFPSNLSLRTSESTCWNQDTFIATTSSKFARQARFQQRQNPQHLVLGSCRLLGSVAINVQKTLGQHAEGDLVATNAWSLNPEVHGIRPPNYWWGLLQSTWEKYDTDVFTLENRYYVIHVDGLKEPVFFANKWQKQIRHNASTKAGKLSSSSPYLASVAFKCFFKE